MLPTSRWRGFTHSAAKCHLEHVLHKGRTGTNPIYGDVYMPGPDCAEEQLNRATTQHGWSHNAFASHAVQYQVLAWEQMKTRRLQLRHKIVEMKQHQEESQNRKEPSFPKLTFKADSSESAEWVRLLSTDTSLEVLVQKGVPHGFHRGPLLDILFKENVPIIKATWFIRVVYLNTESKASQRSHVWTKVLKDYLAKLLRALSTHVPQVDMSAQGTPGMKGNANTSGAGKGLNGGRQSALEPESGKGQPRKRRRKRQSDKDAVEPGDQKGIAMLLRKWHYMQRLLEWHFDQGLVLRAKLLSWLLSQLRKYVESCSLSLVLLLAAATRFLTHLCHNQRHALRLWKLTQRLMETGSNANSALGSSVQQSANAIQRYLLQAVPNTQLWVSQVSSRGASPSMQSACPSAGSSSLGTGQWPGMVKVRLIALLDELQHTKQYETDARTINGYLSGTPWTRPSVCSCCVADHPLCVLLTWAVTKERAFNVFAPYTAALVLARFSELTLPLGDNLERCSTSQCFAAQGSLQEVLLHFLDMFVPESSVERNRVVRLFSLLIEQSLFCYHQYVRHLITTGCLKVTPRDSQSPEEQTGVLAARHRFYACNLALKDHSRHSLNQRRTALFGVHDRSEARLWRLGRAELLGFFYHSSDGIFLHNEYANVTRRGKRGLWSERDISNFPQLYKHVAKEHRPDGITPNTAANSTTDLSERAEACQLAPSALCRLLFAMRALPLFYCSRLFKLLAGRLQLLLSACCADCGGTSQPAECRSCCGPSRLLLFCRVVRQFTSLLEGLQLHMLLRDCVCALLVSSRQLESQLIMMVQRHIPLFPAPLHLREMLLAALRRLPRKAHALSLIVNVNWPAGFAENLKHELNQTSSWLCHAVPSSAKVHVIDVLADLVSGSATLDSALPLLRSCGSIQVQKGVLRSVLAISLPGTSPCSKSMETNTHKWRRRRLTELCFVLWNHNLTGRSNDAAAPDLSLGRLFHQLLTSYATSSSRSKWQTCFDDPRELHVKSEPDTLGAYASAEYWLFCFGFMLLDWRLIPLAVLCEVVLIPLLQNIQAPARIVGARFVTILMGHCVCISPSSKRKHSPEPGVNEQCCCLARCPVDVQRAQGVLRAGSLGTLFPLVLAFHNKVKTCVAKGATDEQEFLLLQRARDAMLANAVFRVVCFMQPAVWYHSYISALPIQDALVLHNAVVKHAPAFVTSPNSPTNTDCKTLQMQSEENHVSQLPSQDVLGTIRNLTPLTLHRWISVQLALDRARAADPKVDAGAANVDSEQRPPLLVRHVVRQLLQCARSGTKDALALSVAALQLLDSSVASEVSVAIDARLCADQMRLEQTLKDTSCEQSKSNIEETAHATAHAAPCDPGGQWHLLKRRCVSVVRLTKNTGWMREAHLSASDAQLDKGHERNWVRDAARDLSSSQLLALVAGLAQRPGACNARKDLVQLLLLQLKMIGTALNTTCWPTLSALIVTRIRHFVVLRLRCLQYFVAKSPEVLEDVSEVLVLILRFLTSPVIQAGYGDPSPPVEVHPTSLAADDCDDDVLDTENAQESWPSTCAFDIVLEVFQTIIAGMTWTGQRASLSSAQPELAAASATIFCQLNTELLSECRRRPFSEALQCRIAQAIPNAPVNGDSNKFALPEELEQPAAGTAMQRPAQRARAEKPMDQWMVLEAVPQAPLVYRILKRSSALQKRRVH